VRINLDNRPAHKGASAREAFGKTRRLSQRKAEQKKVPDQWAGNATPDEFRS
jgi:hypothetical protein